MEIKFEPFGTTQKKLDELVKLGLKYDKRQKKQMLAAANVELPSKENIVEFEENIGFELPADYKNFLMRINGGIPNKSIVKIPSLGEKAVQSFFALVNPVTGYTLSHNRTQYKSRVPDGMLPIANDPAGNLYLLNINGGDTFGSIHFWNHEEEADGESQPYLKNITHVADSFSEFVSNIR